MADFENIPKFNLADFLARRRQAKLKNPNTGLDYNDLLNQAESENEGYTTSGSFKGPKQQQREPLPKDDALLQQAQYNTTDADFLSRTYGTLIDFTKNFATGVFGVAEGIVDFGAGLLGGTVGAFGISTEGFEDFIKVKWSDDLGSLTGQALNLATGVLNWQYYSGIYEDISKGDFSYENLVNGKYDAAKYSFFNGEYGETTFMENVSQTLGQLAPIIALSIVSGGAGAAAAAGTAKAATLTPAAAKAISMIGLSVSAGGRSVETALQEDYNLGQSLAYGTASGLTEGFIESWFGSVGGAFGQAIGAGKLFGTNVAKKALSTTLGRWLRQSAEEGFEEVAADVADRGLRAVFLNQSFEEQGNYKIEDALNTFAISFVSTFISQGFNSQNAIINGKKVGWVGNQAAANFAQTEEFLKEDQKNFEKGVAKLQSEIGSDFIVPNENGIYEYKGMRFNINEGAIQDPARLNNLKKLNQKAVDSQKLYDDRKAKLDIEFEKQGINRKDLDLESANQMTVELNNLQKEFDVLQKSKQFIKAFTYTMDASGALVKTQANLNTEEGKRYVILSKKINELRIMRSHLVGKYKTALDVVNKLKENSFENVQFNETKDASGNAVISGKPIADIASTDKNIPFYSDLESYIDATNSKGYTVRFYIKKDGSVANYDDEFLKNEQLDVKSYTVTTKQIKDNYIKGFDSLLAYHNEKLQSIFEIIEASESNKSAFVETKEYFKNMEYFKTGIETRNRILNEMESMLSTLYGTKINGKELITNEQKGRIKEFLREKNFYYNNIEESEALLAVVNAYVVFANNLDILLTELGSSYVNGGLFLEEYFDVKSWESGEDFKVNEALDKKTIDNNVLLVDTESVFGRIKNFMTNAFDSLGPTKTISDITSYFDLFSSLQQIVPGIKTTQDNQVKSIEKNQIAVDPVTGQKVISDIDKAIRESTKGQYGFVDGTFYPETFSVNTVLQDDTVSGVPVTDKAQMFGFHSGNLGKTQYYFQMTGKTTNAGHFGTGSYFVGREMVNETGEIKTKDQFIKTLETYNQKQGAQAQIKVVNFDNYNLLSFENEQKALGFYELLKDLNNDFFNSDRTIAERIWLLRLDYLNMPFIVKKIISQTGVNRALQVTLDYIDGLAKIGETNLKNGNYPSPSTIFLKELGFQGVDVRNLSGLNNFEYGSVIFDIDVSQAKGVLPFEKLSDGRNQADKIQRLKRYAQKNIEALMSFWSKSGEQRYKNVELFSFNPLASKTLFDLVDFDKVLEIAKTLTVEEIENFRKLTESDYSKEIKNNNSIGLKIEPIKIEYNESDGKIRVSPQSVKQLTLFIVSNMLAEEVNIREQSLMQRTSIQGMIENYVLKKQAYGTQKKMSFNNIFSNVPVTVDVYKGQLPTYTFANTILNNGFNLEAYIPNAYKSIKDLFGNIPNGVERNASPSLVLGRSFIPEGMGISATKFDDVANKPYEQFSKYYREEMEKRAQENLERKTREQQTNYYDLKKQYFLERLKTLKTKNTTNKTLELLTEGMKPGENSKQLFMISSNNMNLDELFKSPNNPNYNFGKLFGFNNVGELIERYKNTTLKRSVGQATRESVAQNLRKAKNPGATIVDGEIVYYKRGYQVAFDKETELVFDEGSNLETNINAALDFLFDQNHSSELLENVGLWVSGNSVYLDPSSIFIPDLFVARRLMISAGQQSVAIWKNSQENLGFHELTFSKYGMAGSVLEGFNGLEFKNVLIWNKYKQDTVFAGGSVSSITADFRTDVMKNPQLYVPTTDESARFMNTYNGEPLILFNSRRTTPSGMFTQDTFIFQVLESLGVNLNQLTFVAQKENGFTNQNLNNPIQNAERFFQFNVENFLIYNRDNLNLFFEKTFKEFKKKVPSSVANTQGYKDFVSYLSGLFTSQVVETEFFESFVPFNEAIQEGLSTLPTYALSVAKNTLNENTALNFLISDAQSEKLMYEEVYFEKEFRKYAEGKTNNQHDMVTNKEGVEMTRQWIVQAYGKNSNSQYKTDFDGQPLSEEKYNEIYRASQYFMGWDSSIEEFTQSADLGKLSEPEVLEQIRQNIEWIPVEYLLGIQEFNRIPPMRKILTDVNGKTFYSTFDEIDNIRGNRGSQNDQVKSVLSIMDSIIFGANPNIDNIQNIEIQNSVAMQLNNMPAAAMKFIYDPKAKKMIEKPYEQALKEAPEKFNGAGLFKPIVLLYNVKNGLLQVKDGNHRFNAAVLAGMKKVPVVLLVTSASTQRVVFHSGSYDENVQKAINKLNKEKDNVINATIGQKFYVGGELVTSALTNFEQNSIINYLNEEIIKLQKYLDNRSDPYYHLIQHLVTSGGGYITPTLQPDFTNDPNYGKIFTSNPTKLQFVLGETGQADWPNVAEVVIGKPSAVLPKFFNGDESPTIAPSKNFKFTFLDKALKKDPVAEFVAKETIKAQKDLKTKKENAKIAEKELEVKQEQERQNFNVADEEMRIFGQQPSSWLKAKPNKKRFYVINPDYNTASVTETGTKTDGTTETKKTIKRPSNGKFILISEEDFNLYSSIFKNEDFAIVELDESIAEGKRKYHSNVRKITKEDAKTYFKNKPIVGVGGALFDKMAKTNSAVLETLYEFDGDVYLNEFVMSDRYFDSAQMRVSEIIEKGIYEGVQSLAKMILKPNFISKVDPTEYARIAELVDYLLYSYKPEYIRNLKNLKGSVGEEAFAGTIQEFLESKKQQLSTNPKNKGQVLILENVIALGNILEKRRAEGMDVSFAKNGKQYNEIPPYKKVPLSEQARFKEILQKMNASTPASPYKGLDATLGLDVSGYSKWFNGKNWTDALRIAVSLYTSEMEPQTIEQQQLLFQFMMDFNVIDTTETKKMKFGRSVALFNKVNMDYAPLFYSKVYDSITSTGFAKEVNFYYEVSGLFFGSNITHVNTPLGWISPTTEANTNTSFRLNNGNLVSAPSYNIVINKGYKADTIMIHEMNHLILGNVNPGNSSFDIQQKYIEQMIKIINYIRSRGPKTHAEFVNAMLPAYADLKGRNSIFLDILTTEYEDNAGNKKSFLSVGQNSLEEEAIGELVAGHMTFSDPVLQSMVDELKSNFLMLSASYKITNNTISPGASYPTRFNFDKFDKNSPILGVLAEKAKVKPIQKDLTFSSRIKQFFLKASESLVDMAQGIVNAFKHFKQEPLGEAALQQVRAATTLGEQAVLNGLFNNKTGEYVTDPIYSGEFSGRGIFDFLVKKEVTYFDPVTKQNVTKKINPDDKYIANFFLYNYLVHNKDSQNIPRKDIRINDLNLTLNQDVLDQTVFDQIKLFLYQQTKKGRSATDVSEVPDKFNPHLTSDVLEELQNKLKLSKEVIEELKTQTRSFITVFGKYLTIGNYGVADGKIFPEVLLKKVDKIFPQLGGELVSRGVVDEATLNKMFDDRLDELRLAGDKDGYSNVKNLKKEIQPYLQEVDAKTTELFIKELDKQFPEFKEKNQKIVQYYKVLFKEMLDSGLISQEKFEYLNKTFPNYVPLSREYISGTASQGIILKKMISVRNPIIKRTGSNRVIEPLDITMARKVVQAKRAIAVNNLINHLFDLWEADSFNENPYILSAEYIDEQRRTSVNDELSDVLPEYDGQSLTFYRKGQKIKITVAPEVARAIQNLTGKSGMELGFIGDGLRAITKFLKTIFTTLSLPFIVSNYVRDQQDAFIYSENGMFEINARQGDAWALLFTGGNLNENGPSAQENQKNKNLNKLYREFIANGGAGASLYSYDEGINPGFYYSHSRLKNTNKGWQLMRFLGNKIERANQIIESVPRLTEYILSREKGKSIQQGISDAANVTINFSKAGTLGKLLNQYGFMFINAAIQGQAKFFKRILSPRSSKEWAMFLLKAILFQIGARLINDLLYFDEKDYDALPYYVKDTNYLIKTGDVYLKIPKGRVVGIVNYFLGIGDRIKDPDFDVFEIYSQIDPFNGFRGVWSPLSDVANNRTWFGGEIVSSRWDTVRPENQYTSKTSWLAVLLGKTFGSSPLMIDYLLKQYGGTIYNVTMGQGMGFERFIADPVETNEYSSKFYDQLQLLQWDNSDGDVIAKAQVTYMSRVRSEINELYRMQEEARLNPNISQEEKNATVKTLQIMINNAYSQSLVNLEAYGNILQNYELSEISYQEDVLDATRQAFGAEYALRYYNTTIHKKAAALNQLGLDFEDYYNFYFATQNLATEQAMFKYINRLRAPKQIKEILFLQAGGSMTDSRKKQLVSFLLNSGLTEEETKSLLRINQTENLKDFASVYTQFKQR